MASQSATRDTFAKMSFAKIYPLYVNKVEKKGRTKDDLHRVITWLTGLDDVEIQGLIEENATFETLFDRATLNLNAGLIKGLICGTRVEEIEDEFIQKCRYLDKLVDELARGKRMESILRKA
ncbi:DUF2200 domain-containing protein [Gymnodinialimonas sp.]